MAMAVMRCQWRPTTQNRFIVSAFGGFWIVGRQGLCEGPGGGPDLGIRFVVTPLFSTGAKPAAQERTKAK
jgi:hypothetical protein